MFRTKSVRILLGFSVLLATSTTFSQKAAIADLQKRIELLERRVNNLEREVHGAKVKSSSTQSTVTEPNADGWKSKENWRRLRIGMTEWDVTNLLGDPPKIDNGPMSIFWWYGMGHVVFDATDRKLEAWSEP